MISKNKDPHYTIVQLVLIDETGDSYHRMRWPGSVLTEQAKNWRIINLDARAKERFQWAENADLLVIYQSHDTALLPIIAKRRALGLKTIVEYNDNFYEPPPASPAAKSWRSPLLWQIYERFMNEADALVVTGPGLHELFAKKTSTPIYILENQMAQIPDEFAANWPTNDQPLQIGWAGSLGHASDLLFFLPTITNFVLNNPESRLCIMGNSALPSFIKLPARQFSYTPWGSMEQYYDFWKKCHIGIACLLDTPYNRCRSDVKALEMSANATLPLTSNLLPYQKFLSATQLRSFSSREQLQELLRYYWRDRKQLKTDAYIACQYVLSERIAIARTERMQLYESLLPKAKANYSWPFTNGYFEVQGQTESEPAYLSSLKQAQRLSKQGNPNKALDMLRELINNNLFNADLHLALLQCAKQTSPPDFHDLLTRAGQLFPNDLRFTLFALLCETDEAKCCEKWARLIEKLKELTGNIVGFFANDIIQAFCAQFTRFAALETIGHELLQFFPSSSPLRFCLAEYLFATGKDVAALNHFLWLIDQKRNDQLNHNHLSKMEENYLETLIQTLQARLKS